MHLKIAHKTGINHIKYVNTTLLVIMAECTAP